MIPLERLEQAIMGKGEVQEEVFYHGTTTDKVQDILKTGLKCPYLTNEVSLALYYAETTAEEEGGIPVVLTVNPDKGLLRYDAHAVDEPVGYDGQTSSDLAEQVEYMWEEESKRHPEWVRGDFIAIPDSEWRLSLDTVGSCRYEGVLQAERIEKILSFPLQD